MSDLITARELLAELQSPRLMIFDCRFNLMDPAAGHKAYLESHIPGARHADLNRDLSKPHIPGVTGRHPLPEREDWMQQVMQWGIGPRRQVVAYDDAGGAFAARLWWMLRWIGHEDVAVLDGGWQAWLEAGGPESSDSPPATEADGEYTALPSLTRLINAEDINASRQTLVDAREAVRFRGEQEPIDPVAGHIPGALCSPMSGNLDPKGYFKTPDNLRDKFSPLGKETGDIVCYCGSGVTAAHNILAMKLAGFEEPLLYAGSWSEWITDPARPVAGEENLE